MIIKFSGMVDRRNINFHPSELSLGLRPRENSLGWKFMFLRSTIPEHFIFFWDFEFQNSYDLGQLVIFPSKSCLPKLMGHTGVVKVCSHSCSSRGMAFNGLGQWDQTCTLKVVKRLFSVTPNPFTGIKMGHGSYFVRHIKSILGRNVMAFNGLGQLDQTCILKAVKG